MCKYLCNEFEQKWEFDSDSKTCLFPHELQENLVNSWLFIGVPHSSLNVNLK